MIVAVADTHAIVWELLGDARFGLVAHDGAHIFERDLFLAARVQGQLFQLAPRDAAIRA